MITCQTCRYFQRSPEGRAGRCRRNPPTVHVIENNPVTLWPAVYPPDDWCGQGKRKGEDHD